MNNYTKKIKIEFYLKDEQYKDYEKDLDEFLNNLEEHYIHNVDVYEIPNKMNKTLKNIKKSIENECISYGEIFYLENHQKEVLATGDVLLCQWAGISEEEYNTGVLKNA